ncbi:MAG: beta-N-acetylhexosaminidase [Pseudomonadota bacterium]
MASAAIYGCEGTTLGEAEEKFFREADPWGFILFRRNCESADQVWALCDALRSAVGREAPILVDHEGGRVSRLSPHIAPKRPPMEVFFQIVADAGLDPAVKAARLGGELLARDASAIGLNVNCVPMIDVRQPDAHEIVGDRALGEDPDTVIALGRAVMEGTLKGGCLPVIKHIPGHGRAKADSHLELPRVDAAADELNAVDFAPFSALSDAPLGMTAHIVYDALDEAPATLSSSVIEDVIRRKIGFDGLLMTDDLSMKALQGSFTDRAEASLKAGCDLVLHCNGEMKEMTAVAAGTGALTAKAEARSERALAQLCPVGDVDLEALEEAFASLTNTATFS